MGTWNEELAGVEAVESLEDIKMETTNFPIAVYNNTTEPYWYLYNLEELINFLNEHDEFFTYKAIKEA
jgi:hypothetical protein